MIPTVAAAVTDKVRAVLVEVLVSVEAVLETTRRMAEDLAVAATADSVTSPK